MDKSKAKLLIIKITKPQSPVGEKVLAKFDYCVFHLNVGRERFAKKTQQAISIAFGITLCFGGTRFKYISPVKIGLYHLNAKWSWDSLLYTSKITNGVVFPIKIIRKINSCKMSSKSSLYHFLQCLSKV